MSVDKSTIEARTKAKVVRIDINGEKVEVEAIFYDYRVPRIEAWTLSEWKEEAIRLGWSFRQPNTLLRVKPDVEAHNYAENGGATVCILVHRGANGHEYRTIGVAICSLNDKYSKKRGRHIAFTRAREAMFETGAPISAGQIETACVVNVILNAANANGIALNWKHVAD
jgi:hypothetical protein